MTKTLLIISRCPAYPIHLGDRILVWHIAEELSRQKYTLDLLAFTQFASDNPEQPHYQAFFRHISLVPEPTRTPLHYLQRVLLPATRFPKQAKDSWSRAMWAKIEQALQANTYDGVLLFGGVQVYEYAELVKHLPNVIMPYESFALLLQREYAQQPRWITRLRWLIAQRFESFMFAPYQHTVVLAQPDADMLKQVNPMTKVRVIPTGVNVQAFAGERKTPARKTILFLGNYEYAPNVEAALYLTQHIFPRIQHHHPDAQLILLGNAPTPELLALANEHITLTGFVPSVKPYMKEASVFVSALSIGAGMKNKILEALASGLPVVATPISVDGIAVEHGTSALIGDPETLAELTLQVLNDATLAERLSVQGQALVEARYSWRTLADTLASLF
jgi:polysaccharide biosynthesis protein PslH